VNLLLAFRFISCSVVFKMTTSEGHSKGRKKIEDRIHSGPPRKKAKLQHVSTDELPWKPVTRPSEAGMGGDDGILELDEVDDVEVIYEDTEHGRVVRFNVSTSVIAKHSVLNIVQVLNAGRKETHGHDVSSDDGDAVFKDNPTQSLDTDTTTTSVGPPELFDCELSVCYSIIQSKRDY
jgi:hypothetical protein